MKKYPVNLRLHKHSTTSVALTSIPQCVTGCVDVSHFHKLHELEIDTGISHWVVSPDKALGAAWRPSTMRWHSKPVVPELANCRVTLWDFFKVLNLDLWKVSLPFHGKQWETLRQYITKINYKIVAECVCVCVLSAFSKEQKHLEKRYLFRLQLFKKQLLELKKIIGICFVSMKK